MLAACCAAVSICIDYCHGDFVCSRHVSQVVYPTVDRSVTEAVNVTPLYKTLRSFLASMNRDSKRFAF